MLQRLGIRGKILAVVAVPILVLLVAVGFVTYDAANQLSRATNTTQLIDVVDEAKSFATAFRAEGDHASKFLSAWTDRNSQMQTAVTGVNQARLDLESASPAAAEQADAILDGGQDTEQGPALGLEAARDVRPDTSGDGLPVWPLPDDVELLSASYEAMGDAVEQIEAGDAQETIDDLESALRDEGQRTVTYLSESPHHQDQFVDAIPDSEQAWASLQSAFDNIADDPANADVLDAVEAIESAVAQREGTRENIRERSAGALPTFNYYFSIAQNVVDLSDEVSLVAEDSTLARQLNAYGAANQLLHEVETEDNRVDRLMRAEVFLTGAATAIRGQFAETDFVRAEAATALNSLSEGAVELPSAGAARALAAGEDYNSIRTRIQSGTDGALVTAAQLGWGDWVDQEIATIDPFAVDTLELVSSTAEANADEVFLQSVLTVAGAIVVVIASLFIALLIARRIVGPLRRLTTTATAVRQELPRLVERVALPGETVDVSEVQIPVESSDEVGRLAEAFNSVNAATLAIAGEQAALRGSISEMFVNVARRDQVLLNRQLASIDEMERTEQDSNTLTRLFALDHLATRMRRNSESLLVLAGIDTGRRLRRPMPLSDVIRTASSEIELYERVELELDTDPAMVGHSALTAAHLFAELLENATVFSDPGTPVVVRTAERDGNYVVEVLDGGIGMTPEELKEANARVASTAASEILGAQRLGLFVVGRIARRVGAQIEIVSREGEGTTATVTMPPSLFDSSSQVDTTHADEATADAATGAPSALVSHSSDDESMDDSTPGESAFRRSESSPASVGTYAPSAIQEGSSLSGRGGSEGSVDDMIAADAASSPAGPATDPGVLTGGTTASGLPARRRRDDPQDTQDTQDTQDQQSGSPDPGNVMGLPQRATADQMSALEAETTGFTPAVASNEVAPQSAEERAAMFRGFRPRREGDDGDGGDQLEPDAESLGQAARRGALPPESLPSFSFGNRATSAIPSLEPDEDEPPATPELQSADARHDEEPSVGQSPMISTGYAHESSQAPTSDFMNEIPELEEDEPQPPAPAPEDEATDPAPASAGVERVSLTDQMPERPAPHDIGHSVAPAHEQVTDQSQPVVADQGAPESPAVDEPAPSLDDVIGLGTDDSDDDKAGFFGRLFGRGHKESAATQEPQSRPSPTFQAPADEAQVTPTPAPEPEPPLTFQAPADEAQVTPPSAPEPTPAPEPTGSFQPQQDDGQQYEDATSPVAWYYESPSTAEPEQPQDDEASALFNTAKSATPYNPGAPGTPAPLYSPDQLAHPEGWETAGASALEAAKPESHSTYTPVVDIQPADYDEGEGPDVTSEVFSELSSLSSERPKVEKTSAGLAKRRAEDAPPVDVKPIEQEPAVTPANRDADQMRERFSSFYSGTQRARRDVEEMDGQAHRASAKD